jgi:undecaprenyl phosphate N,N'-diacetylbacillosamine 1-phosphate transferase
MLKRIFDIVFSIFLIIICTPLMLFVALLTSKDGGKALFRQSRVGLNGQDYNILKFRTMIENAEKQGTGLDSFPDDPRVTAVGKVLRNTSLDELPQLFNILLGDMSFVGPRPPVKYSPYKYNDYPEYAKRRFIVKPGVTGWAQVNGRNELNWEQKFKFDNEYIDKKSFVFDIYIIFLTCLKVIQNEGAFDKGEKRD